MVWGKINRYFAAVDFTEQIVNSIDQGEQLGIFIDLSKAYDTIFIESFYFRS